MDQRLLPPNSAKPGLNPRDALDILDIRTAHQGAAALAEQTEAGADVLHYLASHGGVATRAAVAANPGTPAQTNRFLADDENEDVRAELAMKISRLMPGLSERESSHIFALTIETLECLARDTAVRGARSGGRDQGAGLHSQGCGDGAGARPACRGGSTDPAIFTAAVGC